jgi:hypothetical protein
MKGRKDMHAHWQTTPCAVTWAAAQHRRYAVAGSHRSVNSLVST